MMLSQNVEHRRRRNRPVADGAARQTIALVAELDAIVLEMDMGHVRGDAAGEIERRLGDRERVAGVEADPDAARRIAERSKLLAAEILVVLDGQRPALVGGARTVVGERAVHAGDELLPFFAERMAVAAEHRRQSAADNLRVEEARGAQRAFKRTHHEAPAHDRRHAQTGEPVAQRPQFVVAERPEPGIEDFERLGPELGRDGDEAFEALPLRIGAWAACALQSEMVGEPVRIEPERERLRASELVRLRLNVHRSPASTVSDCLVIMRLSSAARNSAARATSSPSKVALIAWRRTIASTDSGVLYQSWRCFSVITAPGSMALTRILSAPKARASARVSPTTPALAAA